MITVATLFVGAMIGAATMILIGLWLGTRPKPENKPQPSGIAAVGVSMSGKPDTRVDAFTARRMNDIFRDFKNGTIQ
jgi:hypothetical protein